MKFFIELFRIGKGYRGGIIWWNIIDGWPQISDAVVDWYGVKKLAYTYIKRAQQPFCLMCGEPDTDGFNTLYAVSDLQSPLEFSYSVKDALTGQKITYGDAHAEADSVTELGRFKALPGHFYLLRWNSVGGAPDGSGAVKGLNHYTGDIGAGIDPAAYKAFMQNAGLWDKLEGFDQTKY
jgi:beta-mannosidase